MRLPFGNQIPPRYYEMALDEARTLLGAAGERLTSLKIRPVLTWPIERDDQFHNAYVYPAEYALVSRWLDGSGLQRVRWIAARDPRDQRREPSRSRTSRGRRRGLSGVCHPVTLSPALRATGLLGVTSDPAGRDEEKRHGRPNYLL